MAKRGRKPIEHKPQHELDPSQRNSRSFSFRLYNQSDNQNERRARAIMDAWVDHQCTKEELIHAICYYVDNEIVPTDSPMWIEDIMKRHAEEIDRLRQQIDKLHSLIGKIAQGGITAQTIEEDGNDLPDALRSALLRNFD